MASGVIIPELPERTVGDVLKNFPHTSRETYGAFSISKNNSALGEP